VAELDCDALALLVVRLESAEPPADGDLCWHRWDEAPGAEPHGLPEGIGRRSGRQAPFKHLPGDDDALPYFKEHIERLLFPAEKRGARWSCCPDRLYVEVGRRAGEPPRRARVDLLERVTAPLDPGATLGLIHLSLLPAEEDDAPDALWWRWAIGSPFHHGGELSAFNLESAGERIGLDYGRPLNALTAAFFADPNRHLERSAYTIFMASSPAGVDAEWRRGLAVQSKPHQPGELASAIEDRQTLWLNKTPVLLLNRSAVFTTSGINATQVRNLRSYWSESIVLGLLQQACLEDFQLRLANIGDLLDSEVQELRRDWLKFRNVLWWSQLSGSEIPQELLVRLRDDLGTSQLFAELEDDLSVYSEYQHQVLEERQATALANLQIYGAAIVVLGTLLTAIGLVEGSGDLRALLAGAAALTAVGVLLLVPVLLRRQGDPTARLGAQPR
jgi:hypothetical protein